VLQLISERQEFFPRAELDPFLQTLLHGIKNCLGGMAFFSRRGPIVEGMQRYVLSFSGEAIDEPVGFAEPTAEITSDRAVCGTGILWVHSQFPPLDDPALQRRAWTLYTFPPVTTSKTVAIVGLGKPLHVSHLLRPRTGGPRRRWNLPECRGCDGAHPGR
jgi:hypothetical protein